MLCIALLLPCYVRAASLTDATIKLAARNLDEHGFHPTYGHISMWDVSQVTNMEELFYDPALRQRHKQTSLSPYSAFNQPLASWDVSSVTNMEKMFWGGSAFNQ